MYVFMIKENGVVPCGSDFTLIKRDRKTPRITNNIRDWYNRQVKFHNLKSPELVVMSYDNWVKAETF